MLRRLYLVLLLALASPICAQNLLQNPGFEDLDAGGKPVGWIRARDASGVADADGNLVARVTFDDRVSQTLEVEGGSSYRITGLVRRELAGGAEVPKIKVYFLDADGGRVDVGATAFEGVTSEEYLEWQAIFRVPDSASQLSVGLCGQFQGSEWFLYDDIMAEEVEAPDWPEWEKTPDLHGATVEVVDIADVWTDALLRIPPDSLVPVDGVLSSGIGLRGRDVRIELAKPTHVNYLLIHAMKPLHNLGVADITSAAGDLLARTSETTVLVASEVIREADITGFTIDIPDDAPVHLSEVQAFSISEREWDPPGESRDLPLADAGPADDLARCFAREADRVILSDSLPERRYASIFTEAADEPLSVSCIELALPVTSAPPEAMLEVCLKQCAELDLDIRHATFHDRGPSVLASARADNAHPRQFADAFRVVTRVERAGWLHVTFDILDTQYAAGEQIWLTLRPSADMTLDAADARLTVHAGVPVDEYALRMERLVRRMYSDASEAHAYDSLDYSDGEFLGAYIARALELDPDNAAVTLIRNRVFKRKTDVELTRPGPADAPDWAVWMRLALQNQHDLITWWLDNRQQSDGQLAGHINDDGEFSCNWPADFLITGDPRVRECLRKLSDVAWRMSNGKGYTVGSRDVEHAAEDQSCTQPQVLLVDYGNPQALERMMAMSQYLDFWTAINEVGRRQFKSYMFTSDQIWDDPPDDVDHAYCPLAMVGAGHVIWYADIPELRTIVLEEAESWAAASMSTDKGKKKGVIPGEIKFSNSEVLPYFPYKKSNPILKNRNGLYMGSAGQYIVRYLLQGAHRLTGDAHFIAPLEVTSPSPDDVLERARNLVEDHNAAGPPGDGSWYPNEVETQLYDAWKLDGDKRWLVEELKECVRQHERHAWLLTEGEPYTDRIPYSGRRLLARTYLGGETSGKSHVPGHWVSWEGGGTDFAGLVLDAEPSRVRVLVHSLADGPMEMQMRLWQSPHGRYDVSIGIDADADDVADRMLFEGELELARYDAIDFTAPPGKTLVIDLRLAETLPPVTTRCDLAISSRDVAHSDGELRVTVHNVGAQASPASTLRVVALNGKTLAEAPVPSIEAPLDLKPRAVDVTARLRQLRAGASVVLDPDAAIDEITTANNAVTF